jgi:hypothetical protein
MKGTKDTKLTNIYDSLFQIVTEYHSIIKIYAIVRVCTRKGRMENYSNQHSVSKMKQQKTNTGVKWIVHTG